MSPTAAETRRMKSLTQSEMADLRKMLEGTGLSADKQDDMICVLDNIIRSWIDQAHGMNSVRLSLTSRANYSFSGVDACATFKSSKTIRTPALDNEGNVNNTGPEGHLTP